MIPYSMAYTDVYTKHLSELTGGTSAGAARYQQQAIDAANEEFSTSADLQDDNQKVQSAMDALAAASDIRARRTHCSRSAYSSPAH